MSIELMSAVWKSAEQVSPAKLLVMLKLADSASDEGYCWPSQSKIAAQCRLARPTVNEVILELEADGKLTIERIDGRTNRYHLHFDEPVTSGDTHLSPQVTPPVTSGDTHKNHNRTVRKNPHTSVEPKTLPPRVASTRWNDIVACFVCQGKTDAQARSMLGRLCKDFDATTIEQCFSRFKSQIEGSANAYPYFRTLLADFKVESERDKELLKWKRYHEAVYQGEVKFRPEMYIRQA